MKPERTINCRICRQSRRVYHGLCDGCGHPPSRVEANPAQKPRKAATIPACPACHSTNRQELEPGRWLCRGCSGVFEVEDFGYVDDRPDINAQKREAERNGNKRAGRMTTENAVAIAIIAAAIVCFSIFGTAKPDAPPIGWTTKATVVDVYDGDTLTVEIKRRVKVRLLDCWAPEVRTRNAAEKAAGFASRDHLRGLIKPGDAVTLHVPTHDDFGKAMSFGRVLGRVYRKGRSVDVSAEQVTAGHATESKQ